MLPALNAAATLDRQLSALSCQVGVGAYEVVVCDNGSTDRTVDIARAWANRIPQLSLVDASARRGAAHARNRGVKATAGDLVAFCEADDEVEPGWLAALAKAAGADHDMVGGRIDVTSLNAPTVRAWRNWNPPSDRLPVKSNFLPFAIGANCAIWRDVLSSVGGWNETYDVQTDVELSWRVQLSSFRLGFAPDAVVRYSYRDSMPALARQSYRFGRTDARLARDFRRLGAPPVAIRQTVGGWVSLATRGPDLARSRALRGALLQHHAWLAGRVAGSVRYGLHRALPGDRGPATR